MYDTHIFLDFEMNPIPREFKEERSLCHAEICEIGAVKLDAEYRVVGRFSQVVRPHYAPIAPHITKLTGITDEEVAGAPDFEQAVELFANWIGEGRARIYSWSLSDWYQLDDESYLKEISLPWQLCQRWMDFQAVYTRLIGLSGANPLSLKFAIGTVEQSFDGQAHRAVDDAANSAELLRIVKSGRLPDQARIIREALHPSQGLASMGDALRDQLAGWRAKEK